MNSDSDTDTELSNLSYRLKKAKFSNQSKTNLNSVNSENIIVVVQIQIWRNQM